MTVSIWILNDRPSTLKNLKGREPKGMNKEKAESEKRRGANVQSVKLREECYLLTKKQGIDTSQAIPGSKTEIRPMSRCCREASDKEMHGVVDR